MISAPVTAPVPVVSTAILRKNHMTEVDHSWPAYCSPQTQQPLQEQDGELRGSQGERFPIRDGIARFVPEDAYVSNFGVQWNHFLRTQLDSYTGHPVSRDRLKRCFGEAFDSLRGKHVLECGCGAGRFTEVLLAEGARVTSVDLSSAVEANAKNCPPGPNHRIAKADILRLPFAEQQFDIVLCLGVIQHTPDSEQSIARLYAHVKPGGLLVIDHYTFERGRWTSLSKPFVRAWLKRQPPSQTLTLVEGLVKRWLPWHRRLRNFYPGWFLLCRFSPITTFYRSYPYLNEQLQYEWALLDTHDSLTDWFKHLRTREQVADTLRQLGLQNIWAEYSGNGVEARGWRPTA